MIPFTTQRSAVRENATSLPPNPRIVIVSTGIHPYQDAVADALGWQLHHRGWWVDRPDVPATSGVSRPWLVPALEYARTRSDARIVRGVVDALAAWPASRVVDRIGGPAHLVVGVHPSVNRMLGRLRRSGDLLAPVATYLTEPVVGASSYADGADVVLSPHPVVDDQLRRLLDGRPDAPLVVATSAVALPAAPGRVGRRRSSVVVLAAGAGGRRTVEVVRDLASWGTWPLVAGGRGDAVHRRMAALGVGTPLGDPRDVQAALAGADLVVDLTGGFAGWRAVLIGRPVVSYRVPRRAEAVAAELHDAGAIVWARTRTDLGLALAAAVDAQGAPVSAPIGRLAPALAVESAATASIAGPPGHVSGWRTRAGTRPRR